MYGNQLLIPIFPRLNTHTLIHGFNAFSTYMIGVPEIEPQIRRFRSISVANQLRFSELPNIWFLDLPKMVGSKATHPATLHKVVIATIDAA